MGRPGFNPWVGKIPWRRKWQSTPVLLPGKSHGQRSLVGYSPWGRKELDTAESLHFTSTSFSGHLSLHMAEVYPNCVNPSRIVSQRMLLLLLLLRRFSHVRLCATPWTAAHQAPLSIGFSRQEYWSGVPLPSPRTGS